MDFIDQLEAKNGKAHLPPVHVGDTVKVHYLIKEGDKERIQLFIGTVISIKGRGIRRSITVRRIVQGEGVERVLSLFQSLRAWCGVEGFSGCLLLNAVAEFKDPEHPVRVVVRRHAERTHDLVRRLVGETPANDPDRLTDELMLLVEGSIELAAVHSCPSCTDTAKRAARTLIDAAC